MNLMPAEIKLALPTIESVAETAPEDLVVQVKYFTPDAGCTWHIVAYTPEDELMLGLCDLGLGFPEVGYVSFDEMKSVRGKLGLPVERDLYWTPCPLSEVMAEVMVF